MTAKFNAVAFEKQRVCKCGMVWYDGHKCPQEIIVSHDWQRKFWRIL